MTLNPIKSIISIVVIIAVAAIIICLFWPPTKIENIKIVTLGQIAEVDTKAEIISMIPEINMASNDINLISLVKIQGIKNTDKVRKPPSLFGKSKVKFHSEIEKKLIKLSTNNISKTILSTEESIRRIQLVFDDISKNPNIKNTAYILIGGFNECYDTNEAKKSIQTLSKTIKSITQDVKIYWLTFDPTTGDKYLKNYLIKNYKNITIVDKSVEVANPRKCGSTLSSSVVQANTIIDLIAFSSFKEQQCIFEIKKLIVSELTKQPIGINFRSMNGTITSFYELKDTTKLLAEINEFLINAPQSDVKTSRFLIKQFVDYYSNPDNKIKSQIFLLGTLPFSKQKFVNIKPLKDKYIKINIEMTSSKVNVDAEQVFINAFSSLNIQINRFCGSAK